MPPDAVEAAIAAAREAATRQAEEALTDCNARWMERANALENEAKTAQQHVLELQASKTSQVPVHLYF